MILVICVPEIERESGYGFQYHVLQLIEKFSINMIYIRKKKKKKKNSNIKTEQLHFIIFLFLKSKRTRFLGYNETNTDG
jgi:hypothetical protein